LSRHAWEPLLAPLAAALLGPLLDSLYGSHVSLCMNACWALGELCLRAPLPAPAIQEAVSRLRRILLRDHDGPLLRNVAITLCRLAPSCPALLASTLHETAPYWLPPLATIKVLLFSFLFPLVCLNGVFCSRAPTESGRTRWC
jgi:hypothetical protein